MKQSSTYTLGLFFLVLLVSHEGITLAHNIRQRVHVQQQIQLHDVFSSMVSAVENGDIEDNLSFLEVQDMQGMTTDEYATHEIREIHKSLKESFSFKNSPILNDLKHLKEIPHGKVLLANELKAHREEISMLLEKAMSMKRFGFGKAAAKSGTYNTSHKHKYAIQNTVNSKCFSNIFWNCILLSLCYFNNFTAII